MSILLSSLAFSQSYNYSTATGNLGTTYSWIDCSTGSGGTEITDGQWLQNRGLGDKKDDGYAPINWPFNFQFYDSYYFAGDKLYVCTNGFIRFDDIPDDDATDTYRNSLNTYSPNLGEIVSLAMEDCGLENSTSHVYYKTTGSSPNRVFTVSMDSVEIRYNAANYTDVQVSFYETSNIIVLKLKNESIYESAYMGIHSGNSSYKDQWQDINGATPNRWREYTPAAKNSPIITISQASTDDVYPSDDNPVIRIQFDIAGGGGAFNFTRLAVRSINTDNGDVSNVKIFHTSSSTFSTEHQVATTQTAVNSYNNYVFSGFSYNMPGGTSYIWVTYSVDAGATNGNYIGGLIKQNKITLDGLKYPAAATGNFSRKIAFFEWDGSTSTDWNTASNWTNNAVPTSSDNVVIPSLPTNQPHVLSGDDAECRDISIESGASLTYDSGINSGAIYGSVYNDGSFIVNANYRIDLYGLNSVIGGSGDFSLAKFEPWGTGQVYSLLNNISLYSFKLYDVSTLNVGDYNLECSSDFTADPNSILNVNTGLVAVAGIATLNGTFNPGTGTFYYSGTNAQNIVNKTYYNLKIRLSSGTRNITNVSNNFQNIEFVNLSTSTGTATLSANLNFDGNITIGNYCLLNLNGRNINIVKNWYNNGNVTIGTSTVTFDGIGSSHIYGNTNFYNLTINKSTGDLYIEETTHVTHTLALTNGVVFSSLTSPLIVDATATTTGGSINSYVDGPLRKDGTSAYLFHVGDFRRYAPIAISAPASSTQFTAFYHATAHSNSYSIQTPLEKVSQKEYWDLDRAGSSSSVDVTLYWKDGTFSGIQTLADLRISHYNSSSWENLGSNATSGNADVGTIKVNNVSTFSPFTFGTISEANNTLPLELKSFDLYKVDGGVQLNWTTATETNNDFFSIERTQDGEYVETIAYVDGAGNSNVIRSYNYIDNNPPTGTVYYRIRQTDFDGKTEVFNWKSINIDSESTFKLYPNPTSDRILNLNYGVYNGKGQIQIFDLQGKRVYSQIVYFNYGVAQLQLNLNSGYYLITNEIDSKMFTEKLIVR